MSLEKTLDSLWPWQLNHSPAVPGVGRRAVCPRQCLLIVAPRSEKKFNVQYPAEASLDHFRMEKIAFLF